MYINYTHTYVHTHIYVYRVSTPCSELGDRAMVSKRARVSDLETRVAGGGGGGIVFLDAAKPGQESGINLKSIHTNKRICTIRFVAL